MTLKIIKNNGLSFNSLEKNEKIEKIIKYKTNNIKNLRKLRLNKNEIKDLENINEKYGLFKNHNDTIIKYEEFINETIAIVIFEDFYTEVVSDMKKVLEEDNTNNIATPYIFHSDNFINFNDYNCLGDVLRNNYTYTPYYEIVNLESYYFHMLLENIEIYTLSNINRNSSEEKQLEYSKTISNFYINKIKSFNIEETYSLYNNKSHENIYNYVKNQYVKNEIRNDKISIMEVNFRRFTEEIYKDKNFVSLYFFLNSDGVDFRFTRKITRKTPNFERLIDMYLMDYLYSKNYFFIIKVDKSPLKTDNYTYLNISSLLYDSFKENFINTEIKTPIFVLEDLKNKNLIKSKFGKKLLTILNNGDKDENE